MKEFDSPVFKVDLDYESYLFDPNYQSDAGKNVKAIKEFEYVFFLLNKDPHCVLRNVRNYEESYLNSLKELGFVIPKLNPTASEFKYWWGTRLNKSLEQKINSKLTSIEVGKKLGLGFAEGIVVHSLDEVQEFIKKMDDENFILKSPFSFSGIGHIIFHRNFLPLVQFQTPMLLEPLYDRLFDLGVTFEIQNFKIQRMFIVENFNNAKGAFKGGMGTKSLDEFIAIIKEKYHYDLTGVIPFYEKICESYLQMGAQSNIQIDSFVYRSKTGELKLYPLVEVNCRKTMGLVIQGLAERFEGKAIEWRITHTSEYENKKEWLKLSPPQNKFNSYVRILNKD